MRRSILVTALCIFLGAVAGAVLLFLTLTQGWLPNTRVTISTGRSTSSVSTVVTALPPAEETEEIDLGDHALILGRAMQAAQYIRDGDWSALAGMVHPEKGVTFTPYSSVDPDDLCFTAEDVADFGSDQRRYLWGYMDGSGAPLELTPGDYFQRYVFNADYTQAPYLAVNRVMGYGNAVENVRDVYPDASFVEFYYDGLEPVNEGFDWCALKLVFEPYENRLMLVGVIHSEWTI